MKKYISLILLILFLTVCFVIKMNKKTEPVISNIDYYEVKTNEEDKIIIDLNNVKEDVIKITKEGNYYLEGNYSGSILIDTEDTVYLYLNGVNITNEGAVIDIENAERVIISLVEGKENYIKTTKEFTDSDEVNAAIYSKDDLIIAGTGSLEITSSNHGISGKDSIQIQSGNITITSENDAIRAKDYLAIKDGNIIVNSKSSGIKATNEKDESLGYIVIDGGTIDIISTDKAIKAESIITINGGTISLNSKDDSLHSNNKIEINNGVLTISSDDDAVHANETLIINNGTIDIKNSYEGLEAKEITINNGNINIVSTDDGINAAGGSDNSSPNFGMFSQGSGKLIINGGTITVNAKGDGLDSNGSIEMNGGIVTVYGPTDNGNGPLDYDATFKLTKGILIASGSSGMAQNVSSESTQYSVKINFDTTQSANTKITVKDSNGNIVLETSPIKSFQSIVFSNDKLTKGTYKIYINDVEYKEFEITSTVVNVGNQSGFMNQPGNRPNRFN